MAVSLAGIAVLGGCISYTEETTTERAVPVVASAPSNRVVTYAEGRYELYGDGTTRAPYYWVWIPSSEKRGSAKFQRAHSADHAIAAEELLPAALDVAVHELGRVLFRHIRPHPSCFRLTAGGNPPL